VFVARGNVVIGNRYLCGGSKRSSIQIRTILSFFPKWKTIVLLFLRDWLSTQIGSTLIFAWPCMQTFWTSGGL